MPDYTPVYAPGKAVTLTASATVSGGDLLYVTGSGTVAKATAANQVIVGVAAEDTPAQGRVTVWGRGIVHESVADGTITAGTLVTTTATAGRQVKAAAAIGAAPTNANVGAAFNETAIETAINAVAAAVNAATGALGGVIGIALTSNTADGSKVRWMEF